MAAPRPRRNPGAKRDELIAAAARVMSREGVAATTTRRIAEEASVPLGTVHYWFSTKDELVREVAAAHLGQVQAAGRDVEVDPPAGGGGGGPAAEEALARLRAALAAEESLDTGRRLSLYELVTWSLRTEGQADTAREQYRAMRAAARSLCEPWLRAHGPQGLDAVGDEERLETLSALVVAFFDGLALSELADPEGTPSDAVLQLFSDMVGAWVASRPRA